MDANMVERVLSDRIDLWKNTLQTYVDKGNTVSDAVVSADMALNAFDRRFLDDNKETK